MNHLAYCRRANSVTTILASVLMTVPFWGVIACTAGVKASGPGTGGTTGATGAAGTTGQAGTAGSSGRAGVTGSDVGIAGTSGNPDASSCQTTHYMFNPTNPTVYLLVDRSGSMFHCLTGNTGDAVCADPTNTSWSNLKTAIEQVLPQLDSQVRFGFTTVWGSNPTGGGTCPSIQGMLTDAVSPALNNSGAIAAKYDGLPFPPNSTQVGVKFESPISESLGNLTTALTADNDPGSKYILLITDGQPDYCDDSNGLCAPDSVIWKLQTAYAAGIPTIVFGIQTALFDLAPGALQAFANAGAGEPTLAPVRSGGSSFDFFDQCDGVAGWSSDLGTKLGSIMPVRGDTLGTYSMTMGSTMPYTPNASDVSMLVAQLSKALSGVRSCTFDLPSNITINSKKLNEASIYLVDGASSHDSIPLDTNSANGWNQTGPSEVQLFGPWCDKLRDPGTTDIQFGFPCDFTICIDSCITN